MKYWLVLWCSVMLGLKIYAGDAKEVGDTVSAEALARLEAEVAQDSANWKKRYQLARTYMANAQYEAAAKQLKVVSGLDSSALEVYVDQAEVAFKLNQPVAGYSFLLKLIQTDGGAKYVPVVAEKIGCPFESEQLTHGTYHNAAPCFSADGKALIFQSDRDRNMEIYSLELATHYEQRLTDQPGRDEFPVYAPMAKKYAFTSTRFDSSQNPESEKSRDILIHDIGSNAPLRFTVNQDDDWYPQFDAKGERLVFVSTRGGAPDVPFSKQWSNLFLADLKKNTLTQLTTEQNLNGCPCFAANGKEIVFNSNRTGKFHLFRLHLCDLQVEQLTFHEGNDAAPVYDPVQPRLAFFSDVNGQFDLFWFNFKTKKVQPLTCLAMDEAYPKFAPNGEKMVYQARVNDKFQIFMLDLKRPLSKASLVKILEQKMAETAKATAKK
ncbi:hypothetical protein L0128_20775 [candidate division KSB1 bacterium]|nr:hypothetical protein [candidate division KSB1 bacterium]